MGHYKKNRWIQRGERAVQLGTEEGRVVKWDGRTKGEERGKNDVNEKGVEEEEKGKGKERKKRTCG